MLADASDLVILVCPQYGKMKSSSFMVINNTRYKKISKIIYNNITGGVQIRLFLCNYLTLL